MKFKKTHSNAVAPKRATSGAAAFDLVAVTKEKIYNKNLGYLEYIEMSVGLAFEIPDGYVGILAPRSSISTKNLSLCNSIGVIDSDYRGTVTFRFRQINQGSYGEYSIGDRIGQLMIVKVDSVDMEEVLELNPTERGEGGYGSTDVIKDRSQAW